MSKNAIYDLVCIGGGTAGISCALRSAELGKKVCIIEKNRIGGNWLHNGAISKYIIANACNVHRDTKVGIQYGLRTPKKNQQFNDVKLSWKSLKYGIQRFITERESEIYNLLLSRNIEILNGTAKFIGPSSILVEKPESPEIQINAYNTLICTGSKYYMPQHPGIEHSTPPNKIFDMNKPPRNCIIIGNGYIASELTYLLSNFHETKVTLCMESQYILPEYDAEISKIATEMLVRNGVTICENAVIANIRKLPSKLVKLIVVHKKHTGFTGDKIVFAGGRESNFSDLNIEKADILLDKAGKIQVNEYDETSTNGIFAIGDVVQRPMLNATSKVAGRLLAERLFGVGKLKPENYKMNYDFIPSSALVFPSISKCGLTEIQAIEKYGKNKISVYRQNRVQIEELMLDKPLPFIVKIVCLKEAQKEGKIREKIIGIHGIGKNMPEIIGSFAVALQAQNRKTGIYKEDLANFPAITPSSAEEFCNAMLN